MDAIYCDTTECSHTCNLHHFDSRQEVTKRPGSNPLLCTKIAMILKPKTEVNFKSGNLALRTRYHIFSNLIRTLLTVSKG